MTKRISLMALAGVLAACGGNGNGDGDAGTDGMITLDADVDMGMGGGDEDMGGGGGDPDMFTGTCFDEGFGVPCTTAMGCRVGTCQPPLQFNDIGGAADPVADLPDGSDTIPGSVLYEGGFCTIDTLTEGTPDCLDNAGICGDCMTCINAFGGGTCYLNCDPEAPGNDICPTAWDCVPLNNGGGICFDGCATDVDCWGNAVIREETNGIPGIQTGADCEAVPSPCGFAGPDQLRFVTTAMPTCNTETFECEVMGSPDAEAGDPCRGTVECETGGQCEQESDVFNLPDGDVILWEGGYCFGPQCTSDADCAGDGVCGGGRSEIWTGFEDTCLVGCDLTVGVDAGDPSTWLTGRGGCDEGYFCVSNADGASPEEGVCFPDRVDPFSANGAFIQAFGSGPTEANIGAPCTENNECFNPFGFGRCLVGFNGRDGYCTVDEASVLEAVGFDVCGNGAADGSLPVGVTAAPASENQCLTTCDDGNDCVTGFGCIPAGDQGVCFPSGCSDSSQCRSGEECILGVCFDTCTSPNACDDGLGCLPLNEIFAVDNTDTICFDVCQNDDQCPGTQVCAGETAETLGTCIDECADATECAVGEACVDFDGASGGERECRAECVETADCRDGETCSEETSTCVGAG